jgi:hypothetical protein
MRFRIQDMRSLLLVIFATFGAGCEPSKVQHKPPEIVGERTNVQGTVTQWIVRETSYTSKEVWLTPEGPQRKVHQQNKYFLEDQGKPRREFSVMNAANFGKYEKYWPVENAPSWVGTGIDPVGNGDRLYLALFDENRIIHERTLDVIPKWKSSKDEYRFGGGNRTIIFQSPEGLKIYDVLADTITNNDNKEVSQPLLRIAR